MKKQEKCEKVEKESEEREEQLKATKEEILLNEKQQLRIALELMEEGKVQNEPLECKNIILPVEVHTSVGDQQGTEEDTVKHCGGDLSPADYA